MGQAFALVAAVAILVGSLSLNATSRAFPRLMMFYGDAMKNERVYMAEPEHVSAFFHSVQAITSVVPTANVPTVSVGLYWDDPAGGPSIWEPYLTDAAMMKTIPLPSVPFFGLARPGSLAKEGFIQPGRLYLAHAGTPPLFGLMMDGRMTVRLIETPGSDLLKTYRVPTSLATRH